MTKDEAILQMKLGKKMTHSTFTDREFITIENNMIVDECGYCFDIDDFFYYRQDDIFNSGWSEYNI